MTESMRTTAKMLAEYPDELLTIIAEQRSASVEGTSRAQVVEALAAELTNPTSVRFAYEDACLDHPDVQAAVEALLAAGGEMSEAKFSRSYGSIRRMGVARLQREAPFLSPENVAEILYYLGLLGQGFKGAGSAAHTIIYLPGDIIPWLPQAQSEQAVEGLPIMAALPPPRPRIIAADDSLLEDAGTLLGFLASDELHLDAGGPRAADIDRLVQRLQLPFDDTMPDQSTRLALLLHLANRLGWLRRGEGGLVTLAGQRVREFLEKSRPDQRQALFHAWHSSQEWNDLLRTPELVCDMAASPTRNDPMQSRAAVIALLGRLQTGSWYSIAAFVAAVREVDPNFQRPNGRHDEWVIRRAGSGEPLVGIEHWNEVEGALLRFLLKGPLHWLGVVDLAEPSAGDDWLVALTESGAQWLGLQAAPTQTGGTRPLQLRDDFSILLPLGASLYDRFRVERFAQWQASYPQFVYQITQRSLKRAADDGLSAGQILTFLSGRCARMPERVVAALQKHQSAPPIAPAASAPSSTSSESIAADSAAADSAAADSTDQPSQRTLRAGDGAH